MTTARFYVQHDALREGRLRLEGAEHHHLSRVLRMRKGQKLQLLDGRGRIGSASISDIAPSFTLVGRPRRAKEEAVSDRRSEGRQARQRIRFRQGYGATRCRDSLSPKGCPHSRGLKIGVPTDRVLPENPSRPLPKIALPRRSGRAGPPGLPLPRVQVRNSFALQLLLTGENRENRASRT